MKKLVRDFVPGYVVSDSEPPHACKFGRVSTDSPQFYSLLADKLVEAALEFKDVIKNGFSNATLSLEHDALADVFAVVDAVMTCRKITSEEMKRTCDNKRRINGGFTQGFVVEFSGTTREIG